ncbi:MAG: hypothetical protein O7H41_20605 [Planctomycetota bacterium]|nr:hypothetical protein [Planctomycetota bacterium]
MIGKMAWFEMLLISISLSACVTEDVKPLFDMEAKRVAVIPFYDRPLNEWPSEESVAISRMVALNIRAENIDDIEVLLPRVVEQFFDERDIKKMTIQQIGESLGVQYVIHGEIIKFDTKGEILGLAMGLFRGLIRVHDVAKDLTVFERDRTIEYPPVPVMGIPDHRIRSELLKLIGSRIGRMFYHHEPVEEGVSLQ